jgi:glycosyltransferase involved in cell wall biosynthesis
MKILVCSTEYPPSGSGIGNVVYNVIVQLRKKGIECTICSPAGPDIKLGYQGLIKKFGILGLLYFWYQVSRFVKDNNYDAVWLHNPYFIFNNPFPRCLITMHSTYYGLSHHRVGNSFFLRMYYQIVAILERYCLNKISKTTTFTGVGESVCEELEKIGIGRDQLICIPNGVETQYFKPINDKKSLRKKLKIPQDDIILLSVGRLTPAKQPQTLINVFSLLEKRMSNLTLCIAGTGELLDSIKHMTLNAGLKKVIFLGQVDHNSGLPDLYAASDYFIMTSIYEGGMPPLTLSEAMASGLPCIVSDITSLECVKMAKCGIVINFKNVTEACDEILEYIKMDHSENILNARKYVEENLDWSSISEHYFEALKRTMYLSK